MLKYKLTNQEKIVNGQKVFRICALMDINGVVSKGELGGFIENHENLSQDGLCWIGNDAVVMDTSLVSENAVVSGNAHIEQDSIITGKARVYGNAKVVSTEVKGDAIVCGDVYVESSAIRGEVQLSAQVAVEKSVLGGTVVVSDMVRIQDSEVFALQSYLLNNVSLHYVTIGTEEKPAVNVWIEHNAIVRGADITGDFVYIQDGASIQGQVKIHGSQVRLLDFTRVTGTIEIGNQVTITEAVNITNHVPTPLAFAEEEIQGDLLIEQ